jgi:uncharacterized membrane protein YhaH (DUF805 family)
VNWYREALQKYATFEGRARRREYWYFVFGNFLAMLALMTVDLTIGTFNEKAEIGLFSGLFTLAILIPSFAVTVRRLHDTDRSGWWVLINFIPIIGTLVLLVFTLLDSQPGANRFGPNPKE